MTLSSINCCVIIPTYNNEKTLSAVLDGVLAFSGGNDVIVINDGSTDSTRRILDSYGNKIILLENDKNSGKGFSLRKGFKKAIESGFSNAITIDSDGQHYPSDIPKFIEAAQLQPGNLLMGTRNMMQDGVPGKSSFGNKFSNFWFWAETGIKLPDTQTGFRLYPLEPMKKIKLFTRKFELEIEVIVKMAWRNVQFTSVPINVLYDKATRVSHFRPFRDFTRISILNTWFVILTLLWFLPKRLFFKVKKKGLLTIIREEAYNIKETNFTKALSIAFGVFMGIVPIWGFQLLVGIPLAILFRMNKVLFIAAANVSVPPMIPPIIFLSYYTGSFFVKNKVQLESMRNITREYIHTNMTQYAIGATVLAAVAGFVIFWVSLFLFSLGRPKRPSFK